MKVARKHNKFIVALSCSVSIFLPLAATAQIRFVSGVSLPTGGEIVSYANGQLLATNSASGGNHSIQIYSLTGSGLLTSGLSVDLASTFGGAANIASVSSVLADARGFGVVWWMSSTMAVAMWCLAALSPTPESVV